MRKIVKKHEKMHCILHITNSTRILRGTSNKTKQVTREREEEREVEET